MRKILIESQPLPFRKTAAKFLKAKLSHVVRELSDPENCVSQLSDPGNRFMNVSETIICDTPEHSPVTPRCFAL